MDGTGDRHVKQSKSGQKDNEHIFSLISLISYMCNTYIYIYVYDCGTI